MALLAILFLSSNLFALTPPGITKIEPPNWWPNHSLNPIQLLITGKNLHNATVQTSSSGFTILSTTSAGNGTYLFLDVDIAKEANAGTYSFTVKTKDGETAFPFPLLEPLPRENRFQGLSRYDIVYLLMPDRFANGDLANDDPAISKGLLDRTKTRYYHGGDLQGVIDHLPYLKELGITAIWMNPVYDNNNKLNEKETYDNLPITDYHGYGPVDYYAVEEHFGDLALYKKLVDSAHKLKIKIIQDQVCNHTGPYHPWVKNPPMPDWYNGTAEKHLNNTWQTWTLPDPYSLLSMKKETLDGWFINILPDMNQNNPATSHYLIQNTLWWIGISGIDAIRQDTLPYVPRKFWSDWTSAIKKEYPSFNIIGEFFDGDAAKVSYYQGGRKHQSSKYVDIDTGIDLLFDFPLYYKIRDVFAFGKSIREIPIELAHDQLYPNPDFLVPFLDLHDVSRFMSEPGATSDGLCLALTFLMTTRGIPLIYYGTEIGMKGGSDPDNRRDFPGGWNTDARNAFLEQNRSGEENKIFNHLKLLTAIRKEHSALRQGRLMNLYVADQQYVFMQFFRSGVSNEPGDIIIIVLNNDSKESSFSITNPIPNIYPNSQKIVKFVDLLKKHPDIQIKGEDQEIHFTLPPRTGSIFSVKK